MSAIIGLDLSYTATGMAVWSCPFGFPPRTWTRTVTTDAREPDIVRAALIADTINGYVDNHLSDPVLAVVEGQYQHAEEGDTSMRLAGLWYVVWLGLWRRTVTVVKIPPTTLKKWVTGNGAASKLAMLAAAESEMNMQVPNHNVADAAWLLAMAVHHYVGQPATGRPAVQANRGTVDTIIWPRWTPNMYNPPETPLMKGQS